MNAGMTLAIISLLVALATAGGAAKHQAGVSDGSSISGFNLNHNETLVRDTALVQQSNGWVLWMSSESFAASVLMQFSMYRGGGCAPWVCGANHNETLVRDATRHPRTDQSSQRLKNVFVSQLFLSFYGAGPGGCSPWICGSNHNETLVRDTTLSQQSNDWSLWMSSESFAASVLMQFSMYRGGAGGCAPWICGSNHNETLVRDAALVQQSNDWSLWMSSESFAASVLMQFSMYRGGGGCSPWVCGSNHNETLVRDTTLSQRADDSSLRLSSVQ